VMRVDPRDVRDTGQRVCPVQDELGFTASGEAAHHYEDLGQHAKPLEIELGGLLLSVLCVLSELSLDLPPWIATTRRPAARGAGPTT
jgi:hypothetical protein